MLLKDYLADVYLPLSGIGPRTLVLYRYTIDAFSEHLGRPAVIGDLEELAVARFLAARLATRSAATAAKDRAQLRALWECAARRGLVTTWPAIRRIRVPERVPEAWLEDDMRRLLEAAGRAPGRVAHVPAGDFWAALVLLLYETGERINAALQLRWSDVREDCVLFRAETRKGGRRDRIGWITAECREILRRLEGAPLVFPWDRSHSMLWHRLGVILKSAGLPADRRSKFHRLRRTCASFYTAAGGDAQELLDHSSRAVTVRYLDPRLTAGPRASGIIPRVGRLLRVSQHEITQAQRLHQLAEEEPERLVGQGVNHVMPHFARR